MFNLTISTENSAFENGIDLEVARILLDISKKVESGYTEGKVKDINGNTVGKFNLIDG